MQDELNKAKTAAVSFGIGAIVAGLGGLMLCFAIAYLIHLSGLDLWLCYLIVAVVFLGTAGALFAAAYNRVKNMSLVPRQTVETMKENVQWIKSQT